MIDFSKGHIKLYLYNDVELVENLRKAFKDDKILSIIFKKFKSGSDLYYIRFKDGIYMGFNSVEFTGLDTKNIRYINGIDLLTPIIPDELFQM